MMTIITLFVFFKQKTAYEMRISDWSADVCSADLGRCPRPGWLPSHGGRRPHTAQMRSPARADRDRRCRPRGPQASRRPLRTGSMCDRRRRRAEEARQASRQAATGRGAARSEEHTSELQSLMRNSYAVFCLKKKKTKITL